MRQQKSVKLKLFPAICGICRNLVQREKVKFTLYVNIELFLLCTIF